MSTTMSDIAKRAGTSVAAVSVTLNGAKSKTLGVSAATRRRILLAAEELGYRRNPHAGALATGRSTLIGLMFPESGALGRHDPFYSLVSTGVSACATERGYNLMLYAGASGDEHPFVDRLASGLILVSPPSDSRLFEECRRQRVPYVTIMAGPLSARLTIDSDDRQGGFLATRHLIDLGHRRIAHLKGRPGVATTEPRWQGFLDALVDAGLEPREDLCLPGNFNRAESYRAARHLLWLPPEERPTAIFAGNDLSAHGAIDAALSLGLRVPEDLSVVGYDDTWYATVVRPTLSTINLGAEKIGFQACELLLELLNEGGPEEAHEVLPSYLTVRDSSGLAPEIRAKNEMLREV